MLASGVAKSTARLLSTGSHAAVAQELFGAFACGGSLVIAAPGGQKDTLYMARLCRDQHITFAVFVPSQLDGLLQVGFSSFMRRCELGG